MCHGLELERAGTMPISVHGGSSKKSKLIVSGTAHGTSKIPKTIMSSSSLTALKNPTGETKAKHMKSI